MDHLTVERRPFFTYRRGIELSTKAHSIGNFILDNGNPDIICRRLDSSWLFKLLHTYFRNIEIPKGSVPSSDIAKQEVVPFGMESIFDAVGKQYREHSEQDLSIDELSISDPLDSDISIREKKLKDLIRNYINVLLNRVVTLIHPKQHLAIELHNMSYLEMSVFMRLRFGFIFIGRDIIPKFPLKRLCRNRREELKREISLQLQKSNLEMKKSEIATISSFCAKYAPTTHVEGRKDNILWAESIIDRYKLKSVTTAVGLYNITYSSFIIYAAYLKGAKIVGIQHGGYYGYTSPNTIVTHVEGQVCDYFLSWGWKHWPTNIGPTTTNVIPTGCFYLEESADIEQVVESPKTILYCPTGFNWLPQALDENYDLASIRSIWKKNLRTLCTFLERNSIDLTIKLYWGEKGVALDKFAKDIFEKHQINYEKISSGSARDYFSEYDIILWDSVGTGFFESLASRKMTFLLPSASCMPVRGTKKILSSKFFLPANGRGSSLNRAFNEALEESKEFIDEFGKISNQSLLKTVYNIVK